MADARRPRIVVAEDDPAILDLVRTRLEIAGYEAFYARDGFRASYFAMVGEYGTHVDPPAHVAAAGRTLDEIPPHKIPSDEMILPLVVLDDTPYPAGDPAHAFTLDDLAAREKRHGPVPKGGRGFSARVLTILP